MILGLFQGVFGDFDGVALPFLEHRQVQLSAHHAQLFDSGGAVDVTGDQQRASAVLLAQQSSEFGRGRGFARAL